MGRCPKGTAEGAIEGTYLDYRTKGPYETNFAFSRFASSSSEGRVATALNISRKQRPATTATRRGRRGRKS